jgi:methylmalonyl-CoA mutase
MIYPRIVTATSLFDGHDAAINIMRRIMQDLGAEVIHLGHNRSAKEIVETAIEEDANAIAVTSYQGGHIEFFKYIYDLLKEKNASHIKIFGGGGGVIIPEEVKELEDYGITKIFTPQDGLQMGLEGMVQYLIEKCSITTFDESKFEYYLEHSNLHLPQLISLVENLVNENRWNEKHNQLLISYVQNIKNNPITIGFSGVGGAGKSSLIDELIRNFKLDFSDKKLALLAIDPTKKGKGALLGDRIRFNSLPAKNIYMRSMATRTSTNSVAKASENILKLFKIAGYDLIFIETAGIGQVDIGTSGITDINIYVMTPEYGAALQLEKINMIDVADIVVINKFDKPGAEDALYEVRKQYRRSHKLFDTPLEKLPVYYTLASSFNNIATNYFYKKLMERIGYFKASEDSPPEIKVHSIIPPERNNYLHKISETIEKYHSNNEKEIERVSHLYELENLKKNITDDDINKQIISYIDDKIKKLKDEISDETFEKLKKWKELKKAYKEKVFTVNIKNKKITYELTFETLSKNKIRKVDLPKTEHYGEILKFICKENLPGYFPFTAGVFPFKRQDEKPTRMFAGEGTPERTNRRFHYLSKDSPFKRLSTAFDSITLYGQNPNIRPDIYGKIGNSGVSVATIDDAKKLYSGFDLTDEHTSVSMTINGPAPIMLAMFFNTAIDQEVEKYLLKNKGEEWIKNKVDEIYKDKQKPKYNTEFGLKIKDNEHLGLRLLGVNGDELIDKNIYENIKSEALKKIRGTVQADILKEDQAQNTCIFSVDFAMKILGDIEQYFVEKSISNFYSLSISGYHMAEAGANPITQLAFTLANGFTYVEYFKALNLDVNKFLKNFSFFFSNGMDIEYSVIGRVARRIWSVAMKYLYDADERGQKLKYHIQTSGRSLHEISMAFNDIRTTLQALTAIYDNCNSLHTNAYDEAITTPTEESVRQALAIQMIINTEFGMAKNDNPLQGSFLIEELTDLVEKEVLKEFKSISRRGGVLGAMDFRYQRNKIQEESLYYEELKNSKKLPIVGVNTFLDEHELEKIKNIKLSRSSESEKRWQLENLQNFHKRNEEEANKRLVEVERDIKKGENIFNLLMEITKYCSLGQITSLFERMGGLYRRNM